MATSELSQHRTVAVVMGVSGIGKTTIGLAAAAALGVDFVDADSLHPPESVAKMAAGVPLDDDDRWPWLAAVADVLRTWSDTGGSSGRGGIIACSALKRRYRDALRKGGAPGLRFVYLRASRDAIAARLAARVGHYMPASLLASQLAALEEPAEDEGGIGRVLVSDAEAPAEDVAARAAEWLRSDGAT